MKIMGMLKKHNYITSLFLFLILVFVVIAAMCFGSSKMSIQDFFCALFFKDGYKIKSVILYSIRLPRVLGAVIAGAGLSLSGVLLQKVTGNDLASPNIIGVNAGAGTAVILFLFFVPAAGMLISGAAFLGAFLTTLIIMAVAKAVGGSKISVILSGVAFTALLNAVISFISLMDTDVLAAYNYFSVGGLSGVNTDELIVPGIIVALCIVGVLLMSGKIDILCLGDDMASSLGVRVKLLRMLCFILASASAAAVVSFVGLLGFVGLVVPHIARKLSGEKTIRVTVNSVLCGAVIVVLGDLLGRTLFAPTEIPVGIMMALVGAPFFFVLLIRRRGDLRA